MTITRMLAFVTAVLGGCGRLRFEQVEDGSPGSCAGELAYNSVGDGTASSPYLICTAAQWVDIAAHPESWAAHFELAADIDLSAIAPPHPVTGTQLVPFSGVIDGERHVIRGFTNATGQDQLGLLGHVSGAQAEIKNIALVDAQLWTGATSGGLVGFLELGTVRNAATLGTSCYVRSAAYANHRGSLIGETGPGASVVDVFGTCLLDGAGGGVGGLIGHNEGSVTNCYFARSDVINNAGGNLVGGLVGVNNGSVANCFANTDVHGNDDLGNSVGLLIGAGAPDNSYYASNRTCINDQGPCTIFGIGVDLVGQPGYFFDRTNAPLASWDFDAVWMEHGNTEPTLTWLPAP